jgi:hypothetical protein
MDLDSATNLIIERTAVDAVDLRLRVRYARAAGLLPSKPRGGPPGRIAPPQLESLQATILLLTCLSGGHKSERHRQFGRFGHFRGTEPGPPSGSSFFF